MRLVKSHGLGNDYLVLDSAEPMDAQRAIGLCDRHRGVGGDGVLEPLESARADYGLRIWNPDGSTAEKSGNGLRIFARYLVDHRLAGLSFTVEVGGGIVRCEVNPADGSVRVEMGRAQFAAAAVPAQMAMLDTPVDICGVTLGLTAVGMGNPHCVSFHEGPLDALPWRRWGAVLEHHPLFPNRTNVQFARVLARDRVELRVWERGAGETLASGSSACAVVAAGVRTGRLDGDVAAVMPGGTLQVHISREFDVVQRGPAREIAVIQLSGAVW